MEISREVKVREMSKWGVLESAPNWRNSRMSNGVVEDEFEGVFLRRQGNKGREGEGEEDARWSAMKIEDIKKHLADRFRYHFFVR